MITFLIDNIGTILVGLFLLGIVALIIVCIVRKIRKGKPCLCDCACKNCPKAKTCGSDAP